MNAPWKAGSNTRDAFAAFLCDDASLDVLRPIAAEMGWAPEKCAKGGLRNAVQSLSISASPAILMVDLSESGDPLNDINALAEVCEPGTVVIAVQGNETLTVTNSRYRTGIRELTVSGNSSIRASQVISVSNASGVADACAPGVNNQLVAATLPRLSTTPPVNALGAWDMAKVTLPVGAATPSSLVAWSPFGGCVQFSPAVTQ